MKKMLTCCLLGIFMTVSTVASAATAAIGIKVNGQMIKPDVAPVIINNRTMVPIRFVAEALGANVDWNQASRTVIIHSTSGTAATPPTGTSKQIRILVDGRQINPDVPPQIINQRTMVPIRFVAEALGAEVDWDQKNRIVIINAGTSTDGNVTPGSNPSGNTPINTGTADANGLIAHTLMNAKHLAVYIQNTKATPVQNFTVDVIAKDASGAQIASGSQAYVGVLAPKEKGSLVVTLDTKVPNDAKFSIAITSEPTQKKNTNVEIQDAKFTLDSEGELHLTGIVKNTSSQAITNINITSSVFDSSDKFLGCMDAVLFVGDDQNNPLKPGDVFNFDISHNYAENITVDKHTIQAIVVE